MSPASPNDPRRLSARGRLAFLAKDSALYGGAAAFTKCFALVTFPILTRHFSVADYGLIDYFAVLAAMLSIFVVFGQSSAVARFFYDDDDTERRTQVISQSLAFLLVCLVVVTPIFWFAATAVAPLLVDAPEGIALLRIVALTVPFMVLHAFAENLCKWTFLRTRFLLLTVGSVIVRVGVLLIAVLVFDIGVVAVFYINLSVSALAAIAGLLFVRRWLVIPRTYSHLLTLIPYAFPLGVMTSIGAFLPIMERSFVEDILGADDLGLYAAGAKISLLILIPVAAFQVAWGPFALSIHKEADAGKTYDLVLRGFSILIFVCVLLLSVAAAPAIHLLAGERYLLGAVVVFPISFGIALRGIGWILGVGLAIQKRPFLQLVGYLGSLVVSVCAIALLASRWGMVGVASGMMLGDMTMCGLVALLSWRVMPLPWRLGRVGALIGVTFGLGVALQLVAPCLGTLLHAGLGVAAAGCLGVVGWLVLLDAAERNHVRELLARRGR